MMVAGTPEHTECIHNYSLISLFLYRVMFICLFVCSFFYVFIIIIIAITVEYVYRNDGIHWGVLTCHRCIYKKKWACVFFTLIFTRFHETFAQFVASMYCCWHTCYAPFIHFLLLLLYVCLCVHTHIYKVMCERIFAFAKHAQNILKPFPKQTSYQLTQ